MKLSECKTLEQLELFRAGQRDYLDFRGKKHGRADVRFTVGTDGFTWMVFNGSRWEENTGELYSNHENMMEDLLQAASDKCSEKIKKLKEEMDRYISFRDRALYEKACLAGRPETELERFRPTMEQGDMPETKWRGLADMLVL